MSSHTHRMRDFAERLLAEEAFAATPSEGSVPVAFRVCEKLRWPLTMLAGAAGFHSLLLRALTLAKREAPSLSAVRVNADGLLVRSLDGGVEPHLDNQDGDGGVVLVAHLLGLLFTFIGEALALRLMHDVWPDPFFNTSIANTLTAEGTETHEQQG